MGSKVEVCPICEVGALQQRTRTAEVPHGNRVLAIPGLMYSECPECGATPVLGEQARGNQLIVADARKSADGLLTSAEMRSYREALGLTQAEAAQLFGGGENAFSKYERGEVAQSVSMDRLVRLTLLYARNLEALQIIAAGGSLALSNTSYESATRVQVITDDAVGRAPRRSASNVVYISEWQSESDAVAQCG